MAFVDLRPLRLFLLFCAGLGCSLWVELMTKDPNSFSSLPHRGWLAVLLAFGLLLVWGSFVKSSGAQSLRSGMSFDLRLAPKQEPEPVEGVDVVILDLFNSNAATVRLSAAKGIVPICFISAGSVAMRDPDFSGFQGDLLGKRLPGKPQARWLDIRRRVVTVPFLARRMDLCLAKGFKGVLLGDIDDQNLDSGFPITLEDLKSHLRFLVYEARRRGLFVGLEGADLVQSLEGSFDFAMVRDCLSDTLCARYAPYQQHNKPVFALSTLRDEEAQKTFCQTTQRQGFHGLIQLKGLARARMDCTALLSPP